MVRTENQARTSLSEFAVIFSEIVSSALQHFEDVHGELRHEYAPRTEASIIHDYMRVEAIRRLSDHPRVRIQDVDGRAFVLLIDGKWAIKLKKLSGELRTCNIPTQAVLDFLNQHVRVQLSLPGFSSPTSLHLGYLRNEFNLAASEVYLVCPHGSRILWDWPLIPEAEVSRPLLAFQDAEPQAEQKQRVRPKLPGGEASNDKAENA